MIDPQHALYRVAQTRELDRLAGDRHGIGSHELMRRAARAALDELQRLWPHAQRIVIVCGPGNNGGDGYLMGLLAQAEGFAVQVVSMGDESQGDAAVARAHYVNAGGTVIPGQVGAELPAGEVYVDALFGSGFNRPAEGLAAELIRRMNARPEPVLALDVPSGIAADSGCMLGDCVRADATICFVGWKRGLFTHEALDCRGRLTLARLVLPDELYAGLKADAALMTWRVPPPRHNASHKGDYGHVLVVGGELGYGGAVRLAGEAALRCGAGLVSVATREAHVVPLLAARPELMPHAVDDEGIDPELLQRATVLVLGPGLGRGVWGQRLFKQALEVATPMVLDADGLNLLATDPRTFADREVIITPHPGEAARLLGQDVAAVQSDRFAAARELARRFHCVAVLKGPGSLVADPEGRVVVCPWGNPGMASGGMGDVLAGIIGGLLAQGRWPWRAAELGVALHARAGDEAALAGQRGLLAGDLLPLLRGLLEPDHD